MRAPFDPRQELSVVLRDFGPRRVWRRQPDGSVVTTEERDLAMSVVVDGEEIIDEGLLITSGDELVAFSACSCGEWTCNLTEGYAAKARRFGPYVLWVTPWSRVFTFAPDAYTAAFGPGVERLPELAPEDAWDLDDPEREGRYLARDGRVLAVDLEADLDGPLSALREWPARGAEGLRPVAPPREAREIRAEGDGPSIWIDVAPRADGSRAAYLPGVMRAPVWCAGPEIDRALAAILGA